jgi:hypothetical protein
MNMYEATMMDGSKERVEADTFNTDAGPTGWIRFIQRDVTPAPATDKVVLLLRQESVHSVRNVTLAPVTPAPIQDPLGPSQEELKAAREQKFEAMQQLRADELKAKLAAAVQSLLVHGDSPDGVAQVLREAEVKGKRKDGGACPATKFLRERAGNDTVRAGITTAVGWTLNMGAYHVPLPSSVQDFIEAFDDHGAYQDLVEATNG